MPRLRPNIWAIVTRAVEEGTGFGLSRYNKYADQPLSPIQAEQLRDQLEREIMNALSEVIQFD
jgi:hypothetical protein